MTAISECTKQQILKHIECDPDKIVVIHVPISSRFKRRDKEFNISRPRLLHIGTAPNKNLPRLIEAIRGMDIILDVIGAKNADYARLLSQSGVDYTFRSSLSEDEVIAAYEATDIVALVSTYEGFGMPIVEAQVTGRVVVAGNVFSLPEVAGDGACLVDPLDVDSIRQGIRRVISDAEYRNKLIENGFENAKRFDPKLIADQYFELYRKMAN